ncbi:MAG: hypothetical protein AAFW01_04625 [Pseudomonadota bacterium]
MAELRTSQRAATRDHVMRRNAFVSFAVASAFAFWTVAPVPAEAQTSLPRGRTGTIYGGDSAAAPYSGRQDSSGPRGRAGQTYDGGRPGTIYNSGERFRSVGADAIARVNDGLREECETQLRDTYGAEEVGELDLRRRDEDNKRIYTSITRADGVEMNVRCVVRNGRLTTVQTGSGDDWDAAEEYERPPEEEETEETAEATPEEDAAPEDGDGEERADGQFQRPGEDDDAERDDAEAAPESESAEDDDAEQDGETAEAEPEPPSGPKRIRVPTGDAPRL